MAPKKSTPEKSALAFVSQQRVVLPGSEKASLPEATGEKPLRRTSVLTVSVVVRRKSPLNTRRLGKDRLTRAQYRQKHGPDPAAVKLVRSFAKEFGLTVDKDTPQPEHRTIKLTGNIAAMEKAFGVKLAHKVLGGVTYRVREGSILIPASLAGAVEAVLDSTIGLRLSLTSASWAPPSTHRQQARGASPAPTPAWPVRAIPRSRWASFINFPRVRLLLAKPSASLSWAVATGPRTSPPTSKDWD